MELTPETVRKFLTPKQAADPRVDAWCPVLAALLTARYGDRITDKVAPVFTSTAADAIGRRIDKPQSMIDRQSVGAASVQWNTRSAIASWLLPEEVQQLDDLVGIGGVRTVRMPAPDQVRYGNLVDPEWAGTITED
ncbi:hypothetical protein [Curtobacterium sp. MCSS17_015]|uniref:hypothetical protein n=1 Tax=Curtobacterium sp. MCSS17_015 TaxID=2175666 RepID=UPI0015E8938C|nr:hypothetical protein [Curtobacterium sp. MCSS17_015]WIB25424.1 hypothetical protein DEJ18_10180 [Curtobacterium sp. MCSS17_015]